jgi:magnesium transporter
MTFHKRLPPIGSRPGTLAIPPDSPPPRIHLFDYQGDACSEIDVADPGELAPYVDSTRVTWVDIRGFGSEPTLRKVAELFSLHPLTLADATNVPQRAKSEIRPEHHVIVARAPDPGSRDRVEAPQVFVLLGPSYVLSFQDRPFGFFDPVRERIREALGPIRRLGADYLAYALLNTMVDHYFPVIERFSEDLEGSKTARQAPEEPEELHRVRRGLAVRCARSAAAQRRELGERGEPVHHRRGARLLPERRAAHDAGDARRSGRETTTGLVELYLSNVSQRTNHEAAHADMSVFIPLTLSRAST